MDASSLVSFFDPWMSFVADDPSLRLVQGGMLAIGVVLIFLVFYTTRDILLRSQSLLYMIFSLALVTLLPFIGFFLYLLIRPSRTLKDKEVEQMLRDLTEGRKTLQVAQIKSVPASKKKSSKSSEN